MIEHRHVIFVLAVVKVAKRDVTAVRSLTRRLLISYTSCIVTNQRQGVEQTHTLHGMNPATTNSESLIAICSQT